MALDYDAMVRTLLLRSYVLRKELYDQEVSTDSLLERQLIVNQSDIVRICEESLTMFLRYVEGQEAGLAEADAAQHARDGPDPWGLCEPPRRTRGRLRFTVAAGRRLVRLK